MTLRDWAFAYFITGLLWTLLALLPGDSQAHRDPPLLFLRAMVCLTLLWPLIVVMSLREVINARRNRSGR